MRGGEAMQRGNADRSSSFPGRLGQFVGDASSADSEPHHLVRNQPLDQFGARQAPARRTVTAAAAFGAEFVEKCTQSPCSLGWSTAITRNWSDGIPGSSVPRASGVFPADQRFVTAGRPRVNATSRASSIAPIVWSVGKIPTPMCMAATVTGWASRISVQRAESP
jgi:hypothetical protein